MQLEKPLRKEPKQNMQFHMISQGGAEKGYINSVSRRRLRLRNVTEFRARPTPAATSPGAAGRGDVSDRLIGRRRALIHY
ncbi:hypothetical protein EVAR_31115_1 [Eumeta japonica]|uniref:Uncharacterized protein n=1 Tax=Eumeta variegata TaxID=151549 RepID=A0A4C1VGQ1_EUMVA|nr:hypothetical protein EVAR_31115_1 [Eumeta japonica]